MRFLLAATLLTLALFEVKAASYERSIDVEFPDRIGDLTLTSREELPSKELGVYLAYEHEGPVRASLFVYTAGAKSIPDGTDPPVMHKHFAQVISDVEQMQATGKLKAVDFPPGKEGTTRRAGCGPQFRWKEYVMEFPNGLKVTSFTYLTALNGHFVKLRLSYRQEETQGRHVQERFVSDLRRVLGRCAT